MKTFPLRIGTPDGLLFEGNVVLLSVVRLPEIWQCWQIIVIFVLLSGWEKPMW